MQPLPANPNIERRSEGYYIAGTRISLESIAHALRRGETVHRRIGERPRDGVGHDLQEMNYGGELTPVELVEQVVCVLLIDRDVHDPFVLLAPLSLSNPACAAPARRFGTAELPETPLTLVPPIWRLME